MVALGYLAAITTRIELVTGVLILPQRQTVLVAKQAAEVDLLSGGRLRLGVGSGWNYVEYDALGQDFANRGARLTEQMMFLRRLWGEPLVTFEGQFDRIDREACRWLHLSFHHGSGHCVLGTRSGSPEGSWPCGGRIRRGLLDSDSRGRKWHQRNTGCRSAMAGCGRHACHRGIRRVGFHHRRAAHRISH
jgi:Luciferase-like monooxygenase